MATVVIDLYDSGVQISDGDKVLADSATLALVEAEHRIIFGECAERQAYSRPRDIATGFWSQLSANSDTRRVISNAELAYRHLQCVWQQVALSDRDAILVTPDTFTKHDLGLLLGICERLSISVRGLVSKAVLVPLAPMPDHKLVYIDVMQQHLAITEIRQTATGVTVVHPSTVLTPGLQSLSEHLASTIAAIFITKTRFDPMHAAWHEQQFFEKLPLWLAALNTADAVECKLTSDTHTYRIRLHKRQLRNANQAVFRRIAARLGGVFQSADAAVIISSPSCARVFGLHEFLSAMPGCAVLTAEARDVARQALLHQPQIGAHKQPVHYTTAIAWPPQVKPLRPQCNAGSLSQLHAVPTHALIGDHAYPLMQEVFVAGSGDNGGLRIDGAPGDDSLCKISTAGLQVEIEVLNNGAVTCNGRVLRARQRVQLGDHLRVAGQTAEVRFIKVHQYAPRQH